MTGKVVAVFGGSFNPPHLAHQMACLYVLSVCEVDWVLMVPSYRHPLAKELVAFEHRVAMCERAAAIFGDRVKVSRIEEELGLPQSRTLDVLTALRARNRQATFRLVVGADILEEQEKWYRWQDVARLAPPLVVGRAGYGGGAQEVAMPAISSTEVRARLARGQSALPLVPRAVMDYIAEQGLYRP